MCGVSCVNAVCGMSCVSASVCGGVSAVCVEVWVQCVWRCECSVCGGVSAVCVEV